MGVETTLSYPRRKESIYEFKKSSALSCPLPTATRVVIIRFALRVSHLNMSYTVLCV